MKHPWYLGAYVSDDGLARAACRTVLLYGTPNWTERNPTPHRQLDGGWFDFKHVQLPCPACGFAHNFKRSEWNEEIELPTFCRYLDEG